MKIIAAGKSDIGKVRKNNEDSYLVEDSLGLYAVADGIGGHEGGEVASRMAIEGLSRFVREYLSGTKPSAGGPADTALVQAFAAANARILDAASEQRGLSGMGTTLTALLLRENTAFLAHIGDSRAYLLRAGSLSQETEDHSVVGEYIRAGMLTPDRARESPYRHVITRALGLEREIIVDRRSIDVRAGDTFLLCTDGLTEMVDDVKISRLLSNAAPREAVEHIVREANDRGGVDNITVVVAQIKSNQ